MSEDNMGDNSELTVEFSELVDALSGLTDKKKAVDEATGHLRTKIKSILDQYGWHKAALAEIRKIDGMSPTGRADYLRSFEPLFDAMVENKWRDEQTDMFGDGTGEE